MQAASLSGHRYRRRCVVSTNASTLSCGVANVGTVVYFLRPQVILYTSGHIVGADTDADVFFSLMGESGEIGPTTLVNDGTKCRVGGVGRTVASACIDYHLMMSLLCPQRGYPPGLHAAASAS